MNFHPNSTPTPALSPSLSRSRPTIRAYDTVAINLRRFSDSSPVSPIRLIAILENGYFSVRSRDNENLLERESFSRGSIRREFLFLRLILNYKYEKKKKKKKIAKEYFAIDFSLERKTHGSLVTRSSIFQQRIDSPLLPGLNTDPSADITSRYIF